MQHSTILVDNLCFGGQICLREKIKSIITAFICEFIHTEMAELKKNGLYFGKHFKEKKIIVLVFT